MSRKYVIEIENRPYMKAGKTLYKAKHFNSLVFDEYGLEHLEQFDETAIQDEVWNFVRELFHELPDDSFCNGEWPEDIVNCNSYNEARKKFRDWLHSKDDKKQSALDALLHAAHEASLKDEDIINEINRRNNV